MGTHDRLLPGQDRPGLRPAYRHDRIGVRQRPSRRHRGPICLRGSAGTCWPPALTSVGDSCYGADRGRCTDLGTSERLHPCAAATLCDARMTADPCSCSSRSRCRRCWLMDNRADIDLVLRRGNEMAAEALFGFAGVVLGSLTTSVLTVYRERLVNKREIAVVERQHERERTSSHDTFQ